MEPADRGWGGPVFAVPPVHLYGRGRILGVQIERQAFPKATPRSHFCHIEDSLERYLTNEHG